MGERKYRVSMTKKEMDVVTFCLLFIRDDIKDMKWNDLFGKHGVEGSGGAYHTINDVCERAHRDYIKSEGR